MELYESEKTMRYGLRFMYVNNQSGEFFYPSKERRDKEYITFLSPNTWRGMMQFHNAVVNLNYVIMVEKIVEFVNKKGKTVVESEVE